MVRPNILKKALIVGALSFGASYANPEYNTIDDIMPREIPRIMANAHLETFEPNAPNIYAVSVIGLYASAVGGLIGLLGSGRRREE